MLKVIIFICALNFRVSIHASGYVIDNISNHTQDLSKNITREISHVSVTRKIKDCIDTDVSTMTRTQISSLIAVMEEALSTYKQHELKAYQKILNSTNCKMPQAPKNGGLVCAYFDDVYYCKPMCNQGYDFSWLRRSRLYEKCSFETGFSWTTMYIGGTRLAECVDSNYAVSGVSSAYFKTEKCQKVVSKKKTEQKYIDEFIKELEKNNINKDHMSDLDFVMCGD